MKKDTKCYYIGVLLSRKQTLLSTNMSTIADFVGCSTKTISRNLQKDDVFIRDNYMVCRCIGIEKIRRGFALNNRFEKHI